MYSDVIFQMLNHNISHIPLLQKWINNRWKVNPTMTPNSPPTAPTRKTPLMPAPTAESKTKIRLLNAPPNPVLNGSATTKEKMDLLPISSIISLNPNTIKSWHIPMENSAILLSSVSSAEILTFSFSDLSRLLMAMRKASFLCAGSLAWANKNVIILNGAHKVGSHWFKKKSW